MHCSSDCAFRHPLCSLSVYPHYEVELHQVSQYKRELFVILLYHGFDFQHMTPSRTPASFSAYTMNNITYSKFASPNSSSVIYLGVILQVYTYKCHRDIIPWNALPNFTDLCLFSMKRKMTLVVAE